MSDGTDNNSQNQNQGNDPGTNAAPQPPEGLDARFWDGEKAEVKVTDLIADYGNLSKFKTETEARFKDRPEAPDKYELRIPESVKLPEGVEFEFAADSDLVKMARQIAFDSGRGQEGFDELVAAFVSHEIAKDAAYETQAEETFQAEIAKLGENGKDRLAAAESFLKSTLADDEYKAIQSIATTAAGVQAIEKLMNLSKDKAPAIPGAGGGEPVLSLDELKSLQADPKYWRDQDPAFVQKVTEGFKKLYPGQQRTSH